MVFCNALRHMILHLNTGNRNLLQHAEIMIFPLQICLNSQLSEDISAVASFYCGAAAVLGIHLILQVVFPQRDL